MNCTIANCSRSIAAKGLCLPHYKQVRRRESPEWNTRHTLEGRFWAKVVKTDTCWLWVGTTASHGYGQIGVGGRVVPAYRIAYELLIGAIPNGSVVDHLCRVRACVNPAHLEAVSVAENNRRAAKVKASRTHCSKGHPFIKGNIQWVRGTRRCKTCATERRARFNAAHPDYARLYSFAYYRAHRQLPPI